MSTPCEPCDRVSPQLPKRLSCCDCVNLVRVGCLPVCALTGQMIPMPHLTVCERCVRIPRGAGDLCRRCCDGDEGCGDSTTAEASCCTTSGALVNSCKRPGEPPEKNDVWCHMRCTRPLNSSQICRRCCGDGDCGDFPTTDCTCCQTIQQRMNF